MSEPPTYFVRLARAVEGPLTRDEVRHRLELRLLSGYHEVSTDQKQWRPLAEARGWFAGGDESAARSADASEGSFFELSSTGENGDHGSADASPDWLDQLGKLGSADAGGAVAASVSAADLRAARLARSVTLSAGLLLLIATALPIPGVDGVRAAWWQRPGGLSVVLGVWGGLGFFLVLGTFMPRPAMRAGAALGVGTLGWLVGWVLLGRGGALAVNTAVWLLATPVIAWSATRWLPFPRNGFRANRRGLIGLLSISVLLWLAAVVLGVQQNLHHADANHFLSQLVLTATGWLALTAALAAGGIELPPKSPTAPALPESPTSEPPPEPSPRNLPPRKH